LRAGEKRPSLLQASCHDKAVASVGLFAMTKAERKVMMAGADRAAAPVANGTMSLPVSFTRRFL
jgi:hypothetical protein